MVSSIWSPKISSITNTKGTHLNRSITSFCFGTRKLYDYIDDNPSFAFMDVMHVNNPTVIYKNKKMVAINSAIEINLTGQVCFDSIGTYQYSGIGGQKWILCAVPHLAKEVNPSIALTSRTKKGISRIVPFLK